jgi:dienelactone hydrolase
MPGALGNWAAMNPHPLEAASMRRSFAAGVLIFFNALALAAPPGTFARRQAGQIRPAQQVDHVAMARELVADLAAQRFDLVEQNFNQSVAQLLPQDKLRDAWGKMTTDLGSFASIRWAGHEQKQDLDYVHVTCRFARKDIDLVFVFDALQKIAGFKTMPASWFGVWQTPSYANPASFIEADVKIGQVPWVLPGTLAAPKGAGPFPAVVLVHGWGPNDEDESAGPDRIFKDIAWGLASRGIAVLRYVKRTRQYGPEVAKSLSSFTAEQEAAEDARAAVSLLSGMHTIDSHHIFLLGVDFGGYLAPRIASGDSQIAGLILMGAYARPLEDVFLDQVKLQVTHNSSPTAAQLEALAKAEEEKRQIEDPGLQPGTMVRLAGAPVPAAYVLDLRGYSSTKTAATLKIPMLILQGDHGVQSPSADFAEWKRSLASHSDVAFKSYSTLNEFFLPVSQRSRDTQSPEAEHVPVNVIEDLALWIRHQSEAAAHAMK